RAGFGGRHDWEGASILELGPGDNLGTGLMLIARGARSYTAVDAHPLAEDAPAPFYDAVLRELAGDGQQRARAAWERFVAGGARPEPAARPRPEPAVAPAVAESATMRYLIDSRFDLAGLAGSGFSRVVSQAAFEHFDDIARTIRGVTAACAPGARFIAEIDLKTHTRWIRDVDPLNIYRYPDWYYDLWKFSGSPNRRRPGDYVKALRENGWVDIGVAASESVPQSYAASAGPKMARRFRAKDAALEMLVVVVTARLPDSAETREAPARRNT
ncbi:MAG: hypothetical protein HKN20_05540, partial [Gemmatimonadetes bacterium]|nr:hypothetical protein [Gemmatimonadota bacterium]